MGPFGLGVELFSFERNFSAFNSSSLGFGSNFLDFVRHFRLELSALREGLLVLRERLRRRIINFQPDIALSAFRKFSFCNDGKRHWVRNYGGSPESSAFIPDLLQFVSVFTRAKPGRNPNL
jgi:hypothetical protein